MVRWVFRPYTQVWRTICTSVTLRASTRVSPGFTLLRNSSPSFGSQRICSDSVPSLNCLAMDRPVMHFSSFYEKRKSHQLLSLRPRVLTTQRLAYTLDSLVRVSRRVEDSWQIKKFQHPRQWKDMNFTQKLSQMTIPSARPPKDQDIHQDP